MDEYRIKFIKNSINKHSNMKIECIRELGCIKFVNEKGNLIFKVTEPLYALSNKTLINVVLVQLEQNFCATVDYIW